jgi:transposase
LQGTRQGEVLPWAERRRRWSWKEKMQIVAESLAPGAVASVITRRCGLHRNQLYAWRKEVRETADDATATRWFGTARLRSSVRRV